MWEEMVRIRSGDVYIYILYYTAWNMQEQKASKSRMKVKEMNHMQTT